MTTDTHPAATRPATPEDRAPQAALFDQCFSRSDGSEVLPWRYDQCSHGEALCTVVDQAAGNPAAGTPAAGNSAAGAGEERALMASYACGPRVILQAGQAPTTVGQTGDVMTAPEARGKGLFSGLDRETLARAKAAGWPAVFGLPNRSSAHIFTRDLGWEEVGHLRPWTFVLVGDAGARAERMKVSRAASAAVPWTAWRGTMARGRLRKQFFGKINVVPIARFKPEADAVSEQVAAKYPWFVRRDHADLNWRFIDAPSKRFRAHGVYEPSGAMSGWCVVQLPERGETAGFIADIVAANDVAFAGALEAGLGHLRKAGASVARAHAVEGSHWEATLKRSGFRAPGADDRRPIIMHILDESHPLAATAKDPKKWYFTDADRDAELIG